jgi:hypothetical protein
MSIYMYILLLNFVPHLFEMQTFMACVLPTVSVYRLGLTESPQCVPCHNCALFTYYSHLLDQYIFPQNPQLSSLLYFGPHQRIDDLKGVGHEMHVFCVGLENLFITS